jgi:hypothetical protein
MMDFWRHAVVSLVVWIACASVALLSPGCGSPRPAQHPTQHPAQGPRSDISANIGYVDNIAASCERSLTDADRQFNESMQKAVSFEPRPGVKVDPPGTMIVELHRAGLEFSIEFAPHSGYPMVKNTLFDELQKWSVPPQNAKEKKQHKKLLAKNQEHGWKVAHVTSQIQGFGGAYVLSTQLSRSCNMQIPLVAYELWQAKLRGTPANETQVRNAVGRLLAATRKADALAAVTTGLLASYQATMAGESAEVLDKTFEAVAQSLPIQVQVSQADIDAQVADIEQRFQQQAQLYQQYSASQPAAQPAAQPVPGGPAAGGYPGAPAGVAAGVGAAQSLGSGDYGAAADQAIQLLPEGSTFRDVAEGARAVTKGDYKTAIKSAASVTSKALASTPVGPIFGLVARLLE